MFLITPNISESLSQNASLTEFPEVSISKVQSLYVREVMKFVVCLITAIFFTNLVIHTTLYLKYALSRRQQADEEEENQVFQE